MGKLVIGLSGFVVFALSTVGAIITVNQSPDVNMKKWLPTIEFLKVIFPEDSLRKKTIEDSLENFSEDRFFMIKKGEALSHIADRLHAQKLIRSSEFFKLVTVVYGTQKKVKAGYFSIPQNATTLEIHDLLIKGHSYLLRITIPEGWTISKIGNYLASKGVTNSEQFISLARSSLIIEKYGIIASSTEGYLFPDTYFFPLEYSAEAVIREMVDAFFKNLGEVFPEYKKLNLKQIHEGVILASIVEREYRIKEEAPLIASVFYNRLSVDVGLESCATIQYIITELQGKEHPERILHSDLEIDSLFNTYKWHGLPPGPISNPGKVALNAVFFPKKTDYWYFVVKNNRTGEHYFSEDLEEHNEAKFLYIKE